MPRMKKKESYAAEINFCAARQICRNNRTVQTNEFPEWRKILRGNNYLPRTNKKYYAATIILPWDKREMRHKNDTATELNREREKRRSRSTNSGSTGKLPQKSGIAENQRKCRGHKI
jgi:hypothetical protein